MDVKWFIEDYKIEGILSPLINEVKKQDMECYVLKYDPIKIDKYNSEKQRICDKLRDDDCVIFYGRLITGRQLQREKAWIPGAYCNFDNLCCSTYYSHWGKYLLNENYVILPILEILRQKYYIFD